LRVLAVVGPTASGKTALSIPLALRLDAEIVSMDSRQVYRGLEIGTDKVERTLRALVPHHGLDLVPPSERYSAARYAREARGWVREIRERGRLPLFVGGTGFFLRAVTEPVFREPDLDPERRERLHRWLDGMPREEMARWTAKLDPVRAEVARAGGRQRMARTLELALLSGRPLTWWHRNAPTDGEPIDARVVCLVVPRETLYQRIDQRAAVMFEGGLLDEVEQLLAAGVSPEDPGMTATGYREAVRVLKGSLPVQEAVQEVQRATRAYARRQLTWFRHQLPGPVLEVDALAPVDDQVGKVAVWWERIEGRGAG
jgi:tRNA dimethylallyltransferase